MIFVFRLWISYIKSDLYHKKMKSISLLFHQIEVLSIWMMKIGLRWGNTTEYHLDHLLNRTFFMIFFTKDENRGWPDASTTIFSFFSDAFFLYWKYVFWYHIILVCEAERYQLVRKIWGNSSSVYLEWSLTNLHASFLWYVASISWSGQTFTVAGLYIDHQETICVFFDCDTSGHSFLVRITKGDFW